MARVLYIESSPRKTRSSSIATSKIFLEEYKALHPQDEIVTIDLWQKRLPRFDQDVIDAKYAIMHNQPHTEPQKKAWEAVEDVIAEFKNADKYVFSVPMWNFSIPYVLKQYIDILVQPGYTFTMTPEGGFEGLITGKPVTLLYARGGAYGPGTGGEGFDLQTSYMKTILQFIGFKDIRSILIEPTLTTQEKKEDALTKAKQQALLVAKAF